MPMELMTLLGSGLMAGMMSIWAQSMADKRLQNTLLIARSKQQQGMINDARKYNAPGVQWTRRIIALVAVFSVFIFYKGAAFMGVPTTIGYTEYIPGFWFFTEGREAVKWVTMDGLVMSPLESHTMSAIIGFYFGGRVGR